MTDFDDEIMSMRSAPDSKEEVLAEVDRYVLLRELGRGAFGAVYLARDTESTLLVALKSLPAHVLHSDDEMETVKANFALVSKLKHPNVASNDYLHKAEKVQLFKPVVHIEQGDYLLVMEYVQGSVLSQWKRQFPEGKVPVEKAIEICTQVAEALDYAHASKIIHRDVKPGNVIVDKDGRIKLLDFGLAAELFLSMSRASKDVTSSSGTRAYMSLEQLSGKKQDKSTDQYSLAVMFHELVSGEIPFQSVYETGGLGLIQQVTEKQELEPLTELSKSQNRALKKALAKEKEARFPSCVDFMEALSGNVAQSNMSFTKSLLAIAAVFIAGFSVFAMTGSEVPAIKQSISITKVLKPVESVETIDDVPEELEERTPDIITDNTESKLNFKDIVPYKAKADLFHENLSAVSTEDGFKALLQEVQIEYKSAKSFLDEKDYFNAQKHYVSFNTKASKLTQLDAERNAYKKNLATLKVVSSDEDFERLTSGSDREKAKKLYEEAISLADQQSFVKAQENLRAYAKLSQSLSKEYQNGQALSKRLQELESIEDLSKDKKLIALIADQKLKDLKSSFDSIQKAQINRQYDKGLELIRDYEKQVSSVKVAYKEALEKEKKAPINALLKSAQEAIEKKDFEQALESLKKALKLEPENNLALQLEKIAKESLTPKAVLKSNVQAYVYQGAKFLGSTPYTIELKPGAEYNFTVKAKKHKILEKKIKVDFKGLKTFDLSLEEFTLPKAFVANKTASHPTIAPLATGSYRAQLQQKRLEAEGLALELKLARTGITFRLIPKGSFTMGSPKSEAQRNLDEGQFNVNLDAYYMGKFEITQGQWERVMGYNPSYSKLSGKDAPVEKVNWQDCQKFIDKLENLEGLEKGSLSLPTEAQWEYACRAGTQTPFCYGETLDFSQASFDGEHPYGDDVEEGEYREQTLTVGSFKPNAFGLYDMHGNVSEWCLDWYGSYPKSEVSNPSGAETGRGRVHRGGHRASHAKSCRSALRSSHSPSFRHHLQGFRLVFNLNAHY